MALPANKSLVIFKSPPPPFGKHAAASCAEGRAGLTSADDDAGHVPTSDGTNAEAGPGGSSTAIDAATTTHKTPLRPDTVRVGRRAGPRCAGRTPGSASTTSARGGQGQVERRHGRPGCSAQADDAGLAARRAGDGHRPERGRLDDVAPERLPTRVVGGHLGHDGLGLRRDRARPDPVERGLAAHAPTSTGVKRSASWRACSR